MLPADHPERINFNHFDEAIRENGAIVNKVKVKWENEHYRYTVAT